MDFDPVSYLMGAKAGGGVTPTSELIGAGHTLMRIGKLRILNIISFYLDTEVVTIPVADRPSTATNGLATYNDSSAASMTVGFVQVNTDGSIVYKNWLGYNSGYQVSDVTKRWVSCPSVIWLTA